MFPHSGDQIGNLDFHPPGSNNVLHTPILGQSNNKLRREITSSKVTRSHPSHFQKRRYGMLEFLSLSSALKTVFKHSSNNFLMECLGYSMYNITLSAKMNIRTSSNTILNKSDEREHSSPHLFRKHFALHSIDSLSHLAN